MIEEVDAYLITAAVNEIRSRGFIQAVLGSEPDNKPSVEYPVVVTPEMIHFDGRKFSLRSPKIPIQVVSKSKEVPYR